MRTPVYLGLAAALLVLAVAAPVSAQEPTKEAPDLAAYRPIFDPSTPTDKKIDLAEAFLAESLPAFVESNYRDNVFLIMFQSYRGLKNWNKVLETVDRMDKLVPKTPPERKVLYLSEAMNVSSELRPIDMKRTVGYAEKILAINPKDVNALLNLATSIPDEPTEPELNKIVDYGKRVLDLPKPKEVSDEQWQGIRSAIQLQNQQLLALMVFNRKDYGANCVKSFEDVLKLNPKDTSAHYRLGICLYFQVRGANEIAIAANKAHIAFIDECNKDLKCDSEQNKAKIDELKLKEDALMKSFEDLRERAMEAFARAVAIGGPGQEILASRVELEKLYRTKSKSDAEKPLEGMDDLINRMKKQLGD